MEDADKLMLRTLRDLDCDVPQEAVGLAACVQIRAVVQLMIVQ